MSCISGSSSRTSLSHQQYHRHRYHHPTRLLHDVIRDISPAGRHYDNGSPVLPITDARQATREVKGQDSWLRSEEDERTVISDEKMRACATRSGELTQYRVPYCCSNIS